MLCLITIYLCLAAVGSVFVDLFICYPFHYNWSLDYEEQGLGRLLETRNAFMKIHPTALIDATTHLGNDVEIGAYTVVGPHCSVGSGTGSGAAGS